MKPERVALETSIMVGRAWLGSGGVGGLGFGGRFLGELVEADDDGAEVEGALAGDGEVGDEAVGSFVRVLDEAGAAEFGEVLGGVDAGDADAAGDFFDREGIAVEEFVEDAPTDGVGDGGEKAIEGAVGSRTEGGGGWHGKLGWFEWDGQWVFSVWRWFMEKKQSCTVKKRLLMVYKSSLTVNIL